MFSVEKFCTRLPITDICIYIVGTQSF